MVLVLSLLVSCGKSYIQVFDTTTTNTKLSDNSYLFENDTVKITYSFWAAHGIMSFSIYNKLKKPIYIDWKNSSYIANDLKFNYWIDATETNLVTIYGGYYYNGPLINPDFSVNSGAQVGTSAAVKLERVTFIPPKSFITKSQFYLYPDAWYKMTKNSKMTVEPRNDNPKKKTKVYTEIFDPAGSPLRFRNYVAVTLSENSNEYTYIDNEFYLSSVREMDMRHFRGKKSGKTPEGETLYEKPYKRKTAFYIQQVKDYWYK